IATCEACGYAANLEKATSRLATIEDEPSNLNAPEEFPTPGVRTIEDLTTFPGGASAERQIKTLVFAHSEHDPSQRGAGGAYRYVTAILRGDHQLHETKLVDTLGGGFVRPAHAEEIVGL